MADSGHTEQPTCFVAMPITTPNNYAEKLGDTSHFPHVLDHLFSPALTMVGYRVIAPTSRGAQLIHAEIIKNLEQADLVLCDLSSLNANVFFELGIRTSLDRPVVLVKDKITERVPFDLSAINVHAYDESLTPWTLNNEIEKLAEHVKAVDTSAGKGNEMWNYFGLTKPATPAEISGNPTEAKLDLLLTEIAALRAPGGGVDFPPPASISTSELNQWFSEILRIVIINPPSYTIYPASDGQYRIVLHGPITVAERRLFEKDALRLLGLRIVVESDAG